jgi:hypothetical protein
VAENGQIHLNLRLDEPAGIRAIEYDLAAMYGLPADYDASFFVGRELEGVFFSVNTIHFHFADAVSITLTGSFVHRRTIDDPGETQTVPVASSSLMTLTGKQVREARATPDGTLTLTFDDGQVLVCLDESGPYESYEIQNGSVTTYV